MNTSKQVTNKTPNPTLSPLPFYKVFFLGFYAGQVFYDSKYDKYPFRLRLYDNTTGDEVFVGYFDSAEQLGRQTHSYILDKYKENEIDYDEQFLSVCIESMVDTLDMLCYDKATEDEVILQANEFSVLSDLADKF